MALIMVVSNLGRDTPDAQEGWSMKVIGCKAALVVRSLDRRAAGEVDGAGLYRFGAPVCRIRVQWRYLHDLCGPPRDQFRNWRGYSNICS
jgi:hypothetical protein